MSKGGQTTVANTRAACVKCNPGRRDRYRPEKSVKSTRLAVNFNCISPSKYVDEE